MSPELIGVTQSPPNGVYCKASYGEKRAVTSDFPALSESKSGPLVLTVGVWADHEVF